MDGIWPIDGSNTDPSRRAEDRSTYTFCSRQVDGAMGLLAPQEAAVVEHVGHPYRTFGA